MNKAIRFAIVSLMLVTVLPLAGARGHSKVKPVKCPICHMTLGTKMSKANPVAMRLTKGGKIYYCCAKCKMPKSMLVKSDGKKLPVMKAKASSAQ